MNHYTKSNSQIKGKTFVASGIVISKQILNCHICTKYIKRYSCFYFIAGFSDSEMTAHIILNYIADGCCDELTTSLFISEALISPIVKSVHYRWLKSCHPLQDLPSVKGAALPKLMHTLRDNLHPITCWYWDTTSWHICLNSKQLWRVPTASELLISSSKASDAAALWFSSFCLILLLSFLYSMFLRELLENLLHTNVHLRIWFLGNLTQDRNVPKRQAQKWDFADGTPAGNEDSITDGSWQLLAHYSGATFKNFTDDKLGWNTKEKDCPWLLQYLIWLFKKMKSMAHIKSSLLTRNAMADSRR